MFFHHFLPNYLTYLMIFQSFPVPSECTTLKYHQICQINCQKMKKILVLQLVHTKSSITLINYIFFTFSTGFTLSWIYGRDRVWRYFVFNDVINLLQGVFIFFVLVCKPSVLSQIWPLSFPDRKKISITQVTQVTISNGNSK